MKNLLKKFRENKKGFTLAELLVVVAIVGILVAISIPVFTAQLGKARRATNNANLRAAKAAAVSEYLTSDNNDGNTDTITYEYEVKTGTIVDDAATVPSGSTPLVINDETSIADNTVYTYIYVTITTTKDNKKLDDVEVSLYASDSKTK